MGALLAITGMCLIFKSSIAQVNVTNLLTENSREPIPDAQGKNHLQYIVKAR